MVGEHPQRNEPAGHTDPAPTGPYGRCLATRRLSYCLVLLVGLGLASPSVLAWGAKAYYPTSLTPVMPDAEQARQVAVAPPAIFRALRDAHHVSRDLGWKGIGPAFGTPAPPIGE